MGLRGGFAAKGRGTVEAGHHAMVLNLEGVEKGFVDGEFVEYERTV